MPFQIPIPIREFKAAAVASFSYDLRNNLYIWFGILWGLPIPLVTMLYGYRTLISTGIHNPFLTLLGSPIQWFFILHPVIFGVIFGILGTIRQEKEKELARTISQLRDIAVHDPLTGLKNRRFFAHNFHDECARSLRRGEPLTLLFLDIDHFKNINDSHGHHLGDIVLKEIGAYLRKRCRPYDTPVRWGGEEFLILLRSCDETEATVFAERVRADIEAGISNSVPFPFTISIGLAEYRLNDTLEKLTDRADRALYNAKQSGRNRVVAWSSLPSMSTS